jgi:hypothetical protein
VGKITIDQKRNTEQVMGLKLVDNDKGLIDAALAIADERENTTRALARAVIDKDYVTAEKLAKDLIPNEASHRTNSRQHRIASR